MKSKKTLSFQQKIKSIKPQTILSALGISIVLLLVFMVAKVQPEHLQASFFGRFFPEKTAENQPTDTTETANERLGFYRFNELQTKFFPIPQTNELSKSINYDLTPATFSPFQDQFIRLWEELIGDEQNPGTMLVSSQHLENHQAKFETIHTTIKAIHTEQQPNLIQLIKKTCAKQKSSEPCE